MRLYPLICLDYHSQVSTESMLNHVKTVEDQRGDPTSNFSFLKLLALNKPEWISILFGSITAIINGGLEPAFALILSKLVSVRKALLFLLILPYSN